MATLCAVNIGSMQVGKISSVQVAASTNSKCTPVNLRSAAHFSGLQLKLAKAPASTTFRSLVITILDEAMVVGESTRGSVPEEKEYRVQRPTSEGNLPVRKDGRPSSPEGTERPEGFGNWGPTIETPVDDSQMPTANYDESSKSVFSVGLKAMEKGIPILEDFCRSYFLFHELDPNHFSEYIPMLFVVEAFIYQLDEDNERNLQSPIPDARTGAPERSWSRRAVDENVASAVPISGEKSEYAADMQTWSDEVVNDGYSGLIELSLDVDPWMELRDYLNRNGLMTERIELEFQDAVRYWRLERKLCEATKLGTTVTKEDVFEAMRLRALDLRILHHLLYSLTRRKAIEAHIEVLALAEVLLEIADDLVDYENDVLKNSFNVLRMLTHACGPAEAPAVLAHYISAEETKYHKFLGELEPSLAKKFQETCEEAVMRIGGASEPGTLGPWRIPPLIVDEDAFRAQVSCK